MNQVSFMEELVGATPNFWYRADRRLLSEVNAGKDVSEKLVLVRTGGPDSKMLPFKEHPIRPITAGTFAHGGVNCSFVVYAGCEHGIHTEHVHGYWSDRAGARVRQVWMAWKL